MKAEAIAISPGSSVTALNQTRTAGGDPMAGDFLLALMSAMIQPPGIATLAAGMDQQNKCPEDGEVINVFPGVNLAAEIGDGLAPGNPGNSFGPDMYFTSPATERLATDYFRADRITVAAQPVALPEGGNFEVSEAEGSSEPVVQPLLPGGEGRMSKAKDDTVPLSQSQVDQVISQKEGNIKSPANVISSEKAGQGQIPYRSQSPVEVLESPAVPAVETRSITAQAVMAEDAGITREAGNVGSLQKGLADTGAVKWQNIYAKPDGEVAGVQSGSPDSSYSGQNNGGQGEKEKVIINTGQDYRISASPNMREDRQINTAPDNIPEMAVKQVESVKVIEGRPVFTEVFGNRGGQGKSEEAVRPVEMVQGADNVETGSGQEQAQHNSGTVNLSNITPRKFPSEILPHLMNPIRSVNADGQVTVIRLKLEPENMGEIRIRLSYVKGKMEAHFYTASGLVREAIECSLPQLKETLAQYKVDLGEATASLGQEQQNNGFGSTGFGHNGRMKGFSGMFLDGNLGDKSTLNGMGDDQGVNLLI